jgi:hypothetical protein
LGIHRRRFAFRRPLPEENVEDDRERGAHDHHRAKQDEDGHVGARYPALVAEWLPALAQTLGAKKPMRVPFIGRLLARQVGVALMTELRGASNAKAKREHGWLPRHASWRRGFAAA